MTTQQFKGKRLTRTKVKNNILKIWNLTEPDERFDWYNQANYHAQKIAWDNGASKQKVCGVIAALSPVKTWNQNLICAEQMVETGDCGHMKQFKNKAKRILECDDSDEEILNILNGNKISAFYLNIRYPNKANVLTIDRHALSIALNKWVTDEDYRGMTTKQYEFFVQCYTLAAVTVEVSPLLMQSATWVRWRKIKTSYAG